jgi:hypothetical protein
MMIQPSMKKNHPIVSVCPNTVHGDGLHKNLVDCILLCQRALVWMLRSIVLKYRKTTAFIRVIKTGVKRFKEIHKYHLGISTKRMSLCAYCQHSFCSLTVSLNESFGLIP